MTVPMDRRRERVLRLPGVYAPQHDTRLLIRALGREHLAQGTDVLDIGTGSGALALCAARRGAHVTAIDIARRSVVCARMNAALAGQKVAVRLADLTAWDRHSGYDMVVSNPPYVPAPGGAPPAHSAARAWDAGGAGRAVVDRICEIAPRTLRPGGVLLLVHSQMCGVDSTLLRLRRAGLTADVTDRAHVPFGPVVRSRLPWLRERGLAGAGQHREELVVIRAVRT
ncbi:release factor glutamine methyltransferase [Actinacidiphila yanglinensis]|uniref:Release factor glutamine methyltransferase n=1 Tax=Actinacidiphila yanglinensis TaxID=310779 RepID=A0A1H6DQW8_9ACTN|nr:HemK2/MTQ2 family protein methyltransferase [Actinacidiphila yanglinensis]SEG87640.1 release factor glutamine methyltransferase [Actinacidiphila yanglinensis]